MTQSLTRPALTRLALTGLGLTTALTLPGLASARSLDITTQMANYGGRGAYLAFYLTDANDAYAGSLWMAGGRAKYYRHLTGWMAASGGNTDDVAGVTGASVGSGQTLRISVDLPDTFFDAGYTLHVDAAAEDMRERPNDIVVPLTSAGAGKPVQGRSYISSLTYK